MRNEIYSARKLIRRSDRISRERKQLSPAETARTRLPATITEISRYPVQTVVFPLEPRDIDRVQHLPRTCMRKNAQRRSPERVWQLIFGREMASAIVYRSSGIILTVKRVARVATNILVQEIQKNLLHFQTLLRYLSAGYRVSTRRRSCTSTPCPASKFILRITGMD